ncbi:cache domain-containing sensor histidine kinase [Paenibacillus sp. 32O-W]|uniref:cache domain-containing sensor histidine kinase n=1 Tax=Paenibacillus sp. 32O-W TaxID=1695218 RepID=UPI001F4290E4|nr:sensor histidine kinase [Paenibacillus sp. 32O-W]
MMRAIRRPLPILAQLWAGMFLIAVLVIALTIFFNYRFNSQTMLNRMADNTQESVEQLSDKIDVLLRQYDQFAHLVVFDSRVQRTLAEAGYGREEPDAVGLNRYLGERTRHIAGDMLIHLFDTAGRAYASTDALQLFWRNYDEVAAISWYAKMATMDGHMLWVYGPAWRDGEIPAIIGARKIKNADDLHIVGDLFVVVPVDRINRVIAETPPPIERKVQVMDPLGNIVYSTVPDEIGTAADIGLFAKIAGSGPLFFDWTTREEGRRVYVTYAKSAYSGWTTIAYFDREAVYSDTTRMWGAALLTIASGAALALILVGYFAWTLTKPIRQLALGMNRLGREGVRPLGMRFASMEISLLYANYNRMLDQLKELIDRLSEQQISVQRAQLVALKAQFRPHFLYNSLNLIYWTIEDGRPREAQDMTIALGELLRYSVHPSSELVTLRDDLDQLERYLFLQRARYGDRFRFELETEEGLGRQRVFRLMLQPLVENAFRHGLERKPEGDWLIRVRIRHMDGTMHCTVEDNGVGMEAGRLRALEASIALERREDANAGGIGLSNLHHQIRSFFGPPYGLRLFASPLGGFGVTLTLPLNEDKEAGEDKLMHGGRAAGAGKEAYDGAGAGAGQAGEAEGGDADDR